MTQFNITSGKASHRQEQFWPMYTGGPYSKTDGDAVEIFKCTECGAETVPENGHSGAPDRHRCHPGCRCNQGDWRIGGGDQSLYKRNFDRIFPNAPGAGI
ncbi:MAG: hypothetical protein A4E74_01550 [Syntrophus sp. PtaB.Bin075]|nr:MAG: hypothetical protein A4E74_01550 [Syntrophus sp. PtaB.Bin075]